ncbi:MAG: hypothetical protein CL675_08370 [Bdellovibrionaceae bacterium]|nr:hypothetical protein [Pseudobdellovibrionaceae bacterium]
MMTKKARIQIKNRIGFFLLSGFLVLLTPCSQANYPSLCQLTFVDYEGLTEPSSSAPRAILGVQTDFHKRGPYFLLYRLQRRLRRNPDDRKTVEELEHIIHQQVDDIRLENLSTIAFANSGYKVIQNPTKIPKFLDGYSLIRRNEGVRQSRTPDLIIENRIFDVYSPRQSDPDTIAKTILVKWGKGQTRRVVINLMPLDSLPPRSTPDLQALKSLLLEQADSGLKEVFTLQGDLDDVQIDRLYP